MPIVTDIMVVCRTVDDITVIHYDSKKKVNQANINTIKSFLILQTSIYGAYFIYSNFSDSDLISHIT